MAKLTELRDQLRSGQLEKELQEAHRHYKVSNDGKDAMILFGKHKHMTLRQILARDPAYLNWILQDDFPAELKDIVRFIQQADRRAADAKSMAEAAEKLGEVAKEVGEKASAVLESVAKGVEKTVDSIKDALGGITDEELGELLRGMREPAEPKKKKIAAFEPPMPPKKPPRIGGSAGFKPKARHR